MFHISKLIFVLLFSHSRVKISTEIIDKVVSMVLSQRRSNAENIR